MYENLKKIKSLSDQLSEAISEYLLSIEKERIIIPKTEFHKIKHIKKLNSYIHVFQFDNEICFTLPDSGNSYGYAVMHYTKLMSGQLEELILNKVENPSNTDYPIINYRLEPYEKTKLFKLYPDQENIEKNGTEGND